MGAMADSIFKDMHKKEELSGKSNGFLLLASPIVLSLLGQEFDLKGTLTHVYGMEIRVVEEPHFTYKIFKIAQ